MQGYVKASADALKAFLAQNIEGGLAIASGGTGATTASGARTNLGLGNVDNTADANKPVSTAQQAALDGKLGISATAADSSKLGGVTPDGYYKKTDIVGAYGNLASPLLHLPLKKSLLTAQGQSVCTFTRASAATYTDRYGVLKSVAADTPRFTAEGLLVEGASTNLLTYSEQFDNAAWTKSASTVTANTTAITDPYGTNLAEKLVENSATSTHSVNQNYVQTSDTTYTLSVFAKQGERSQIALGDTGANLSFFDLNGGTIISQGTGHTARVTPLASGWYRCSITFTSATSGTRTHYVMLANGGNSSYTGDETSGLYIFGAQLEAMPFATSYITTTTTSVTRVANTLLLPQLDNAPSYKNDFTFVVDVNLSGITASNAYFLGDGNVSSGFNVRLNSAGTISAIINGNGYATNKVFVTKTKYRIAIVVSVATSTISFYINGVLDRSLSFTGSMSNLTNLYIGSYDAANNVFYGTISNLRIYDRALTAEEVRLA
jgi:hypothetical protein